MQESPPTLNFNFQRMLRALLRSTCLLYPVVLVKVSCVLYCLCSFFLPLLVGLLKESRLAEVIDNSVFSLFTSSLSVPTR